MRKGGHMGLGAILIIAGITIILSLVLPSQVWWFLLATALITIGICIKKC